jgi:putative transcriptional regulator
VSEIEVICINLRMKNARIEKGISQTDLAKSIGVSRQTINMIENGDYNPTVALCLKICKALDKTLDELFWEE